MNSKKPKHYKENDPFKIMQDNCTNEEIKGAIKLNILKYTLREKKQNKSDLEKIISYAKWGLEVLDFETKKDTKKYLINYELKKK